MRLPPSHDSLTVIRPQVTSLERLSGSNLDLTRCASLVLLPRRVLPRAKER